MNYWIVPSIEGMKKIKNKHRRDKLINKIESNYSVTLDQLKGRDRHRQIVDVRNVLMYAMHKVYGFTSTETSNFLNRNHATVLNGARRVGGFMDVDKYYKQEVLELIN